MFVNSIRVVFACESNVMLIRHKKMLSSLQTMPIWTLFIATRPAMASLPRNRATWRTLAWRTLRLRSPRDPSPTALPRVSQSLSPTSLTRTVCIQIQTNDLSPEILFLIWKILLKVFLNLRNFIIANRLSVTKHTKCYQVLLATFILLKSIWSFLIGILMCRGMLNMVLFIVSLSNYVSHRLTA